MNRIKHFMILALALAMSLGAWAQQEVLLTTVTATGQTSYSQSPDGIVTVTLNNISNYSITFGWLENGTVTVEAAQGYTITRCVFRQNDKTPLEDDQAPFTATMADYTVSAVTSTGQVYGVDVLSGDNMDGISSIEVYGYAADPDPTVPALDETTGNWNFLMPGANKVVNVTYYLQPDLAWTYNSAAMPAEGLTAYRGFELPVIQNIMLQVSDTFNNAMQGYFRLDQVSAPPTWEMITDNFVAADMANFVDNSSLTEEQVLTFPNPDPTADQVYLIYGFDGYAVKYIIFNGTNVTAASQELTKRNIYYIIDEGAKIFYTSSTVVRGLTLRYGSSNPAVVSFSNPNNMSTFSVNGAGEADIYAVFAGDTTFLADSVAFHVTIVEPATLTLAANGQGTVSALVGGDDVWNNETWANLTTTGSEHSFTVGDITLSHTGDEYEGFYQLTTSGNPLRILSSSGTLTFTSNGAPFTRIQLLMVDEYSSGNPKIQPLDGWSFDGRYATWEGNAQSVSMTQCTTKVDQIVFTRGSNSIVVLDEAAGTYAVIPGAEVQVVATAQDGNYVSAWSDNRQPQHYTSDTNTITVGESQTLTATFAQNPLLTLASNNGGTVSLDGDSIGTVYTFTFEHSGNSEDDRAITIPANRFPYDTTFSYNANITDAYAYDQAGEGVSIIAHGDHTVTVRISGPFEYGGYYSCLLEGGASDDWTISCTTGTGPVTPNGITKTGDNTYRVLPGTQLSVTATPGEGSYLAQWSDQTEPVEGDARLGSSHPYTMPATPATLTATFNEIPVLTLASNNSEWGSVKLDGITPGATTYDITIEGGNTYTNVSFPFTTTVFLHEDLEGVDAIDPYPLSVDKDGNNAEITISGPYDGARTITYEYIDGSELGAGVKTIFCRAVEGLPIMPEGVVAYAGYGNYLVLPGTQVKVIATPDSAHYFVNWTDSAAVNSNIGDTNTLTMGFDDTELTANFALKPTLTLAHNEGGEMEIVPEEVMAVNEFTVPSSWNNDNHLAAATDLPSDFQSVKEAEATAWQNTTGHPVYLFYKAYSTGTVSYVRFNANGTVADVSTGLKSVIYNNVSDVYEGYLVRYTTVGYDSNFIASTAEPNTYYIDYGTDVTVKATPDATHYLVNFDGTDVRNDNDTAFKTYTNITADVTSTATFNDKPVLTIAANDTTWGKVTIPTGLVATDPTPAPTPTVVANPVITGVLMPDGSMQVTMSCTTQDADIYYTTDNVTSPLCDCPAAPEYTQPITFTEPVTIKAAAYTGNGWSAVVTKTITLSLPDGVAKLTDTTYRVDYGTEITVQAEATKLHHVANWVNEDSVEYPAADITYDSFFVTQPEPLFPAYSALTLTMTTDTVARAMFGLNYRKLYFSHNAGGTMEFIVEQDSMSFSGISRKVVSNEGIKIAADSADAEGMFLKAGVSSIMLTAKDATITQVDFHVTNGTNLVSTISTDAEGDTITTTDNNEYGSILGLSTDTLVISSSATHDLQIDQFIVHYGRALPNGVALGPNDSTYYVMPDTTVIVRAIPADGHYLVSWASTPDLTDSVDALTVSLKVTTDDTLTATFAPNPVITLAVSDPAMGSVYFTGYEGNTVTRAGIIKAQSIELPYKWYEASDIMEIQGGNGEVTKDATSHYLTVNSVFEGSITVVTSTGAFNVTCEPTLPNGVHYNIADNNYTVQPYTDLSFTATPNADHYFVDWAKVTVNDTMGIDSLVFDAGLVNTSVLINKDMKVQANFLHNPYLLTLVADSVMGSIDMLDSLPIVTQALKQSSDSTIYTVMADSTVTVMAAANTGYHITGWQNAQSTQNTPSNPNDLITDTVLVKMTQDSTVTISFDTNIYNVTLAVQNDERTGLPMGSVTGADSVKHFLTDTLTATAEYGYTFAGWYDADTNLVSELDTLVISPVSDTALTAMFTVNEYAVNGLVLDTLAGYVKGSDSIAYLDTVVLRAFANTGYHFEYWQDTTGLQLSGADTLEIIVEGDTTVYAVYDTNHYNLVVKVDSASTGFGTVSGTDSVARHFAEYQISAVADSGYHFVMWSNGSTKAIDTVSLVSDSTIAAIFDTNVYNLNVVVADSCTGFGTVTGADSVAKHFLTYDISATANPGYHFVMWSDSVTDAVRTVSLTSDTTIAAIFDYNPALTLVYDENKGHLEFIVETQTATFNSITTDSLAANGLTVVADSADTYGISLKNGRSLTITADSAVITQVAFRLTNGANKADSIRADAGTVITATGNAYGSVIDIRRNTVVITSTSDKDINIDQLTIQYAKDMPDGVVRLASDEPNVYRVDYNTQVNLLAIPSDSSYLVRWEGDTTSASGLTAVVTIDSADATVTANFLNNPVMTLTANGNGRVYFEGYNGYTVNRNENILVTNFTDFPHTWYEAGTITEINDTTGMVTKDQTNHYVSVHGAFNGTATVVTTGGSFTVTCIPTVPNGVEVISLDTYTMEPGTVVSITAVAAAEHYLVNWNDLDSAAAVRTITIDNDSHLVANFLHNPYMLTLNVDTVMGNAVVDSAAFVTLNNDGTYTVMADSTVTLIAIADSGYSFMGWMDANDSVVSMSDTLNVTMVNDTVLTASMDTTIYKLIVLANDSTMGTVAGTDSTAKHFLEYEISATANPGYHFVVWSDGDSTATRTVSLTSDSVFTAIFDTTKAELAWSADTFTCYTLIDPNNWRPTLTNPHGVEVRYGCVEGSVPTDGGIPVVDTTGAVGVQTSYGFIPSTVGTYHIYAVHDLTQDYFYDSVVYVLNVERGTIVVLSQSIAEGGLAKFVDQDSAATLTHYYADNIMAYVAHDDSVAVVAKADTGYHFSGWQTGNLIDGYTDASADTLFTYIVPDTLSIGLKAVFDTNIYNVAIAVADASTGMGNVNSTPDSVKHFLSATYIATPDSGYHFTGWVNEADSVVSMKDTLVVAPVSDTTLYATFDTNTYVLTVLAADSVMGSVAGSDTVKHFVDYTISATPATCYEFVAWSDGDSTATRTVTLTSDSTITAEFAYTVRKSYDTIDVCDTLLWNDSVYAHSGDYSKLLQTAEGCDSTAYLHLTVRYSTYSVLDTTVCEQFTWNEVDYFRTTTAFYVDSLGNAVGCDSTAQLNLTVHYNSESTETVVTCDSTYDWNEFHYTTSTLGIYHTTNQYGCDSTATLNLTLNNNFTGVDVQQACDSFTWVDSVTYTESTDTPTYVYQMENGCDSTVTLNLTISNHLTSTDVQTACESFTWINGETYTESTNTPTYVYQLSTGCDSTVTLDLTVNHSVEHSFDAATCSYYIWDGTYYNESGEYTKTYQAASGCDSVVTLTLTVNQPATTDTSVTACGSYVWNGVVYTASGAYSKTLQTVAGCDSTVNLTLTVKQPTSATVTVNAGSSYEWNGTTYTESGVYTYTTTGSNGCDSVTTLNLTIFNAVNGSVTVTACDSYTWNDSTYTESGDYTYSHLDNYGNTQVDTLHLTINNSVESSFDDAACNYYIWDGTYYTTSGSYSKHYTALNGCDSAVTMNLTINQPVTNAISETACGSYSWNNVEYTASGAYTQTLQTVNGCDSTVTLTLVVKQPTAATVTMTACDSYTWHNTTYNATPAVAPTFTTTGSNGCDSVTTLQLTVNYSNTGIETVTACDSYTWHGTTYTTNNNTATYTETNAANCDSVVTLNLTINSSNTGIETVTACDSYTWHGTTYTASNNTATYTETNAANCDSVVTLNLTINYSNTGIETVTACDSYTWHGTTYTASNNTATYTETNAANCDSVVTLNLTINSSNTGIETVTACDSYEWHGTTYTASNNTATYTETNAANCDSVVTLNLTINYSNTGIETVTACDSYTWHGTTYTASNNTATYTETNAANCDSVVTLNLTINSSNTGIETVTACDSYTWHGTTYTASNNTATYTETNAANCDSVVTLNLTINYSNTGIETVTACDSYTWHGTTYTASNNTATYTETNAANCDSVVTLNLTINSSNTGIETVTACDSYVWHGTTYTANNNTATYTTTNAANCDSVVTLNLTINSSVANTITETACSYYIWDNSYYNESGDYTKTYTAANGCDSVVTLNLVVNQPYTVSVNNTSCGTYIWNNVEYTASGTYSQTLEASNGCDSTVNLTLVVKQPVATTVTTSACGSYEWNGVTYTETPAVAPTYTTTGSNGCDSVTTLHLTINNPVHTAETEVACESFIWNGTEYTVSGNYTYSHADGNNCTQVDTLHLTINNPVHMAETEVACESFTWNGTEYTVSGNYTYSHADGNNCTQVDTLHLTINNPVHMAETEVACESFTWNGTVYTESGDYTYSHADGNNCTQVDTLHLTINNPVHMAETEVACESFTWNGTEYTISGDYTYSHADGNGCTQVDTLHLTINNPVHTAETEVACESFTWNGTEYTVSGDYTYSHADGNNCTQVDTLHLTINNPVHMAETEVACESFTWNGTVYTESGDYTYSHTDGNNCTQVDTLHLTINNPVHMAETEVACESFTWNGTVYTESGDYTYSHADGNNCTQVDTLHLTINNPVHMAETEVACESFTWNGTVYTESGDYTYSHADGNGCTQVDTLHLTIGNSVTTEETVSNCDSYEWNGRMYTESGDYTYSTTTVIGCDSTVTLHLTINHSTESSFDTLCYGSFVWNGETYSESGNYVRTLTTVNGCDSVVTLHLVILPEGFVMPYLYNIMDVMLTINHNEEGMENVNYVWYRWYRNGELVLEGPDKDNYSEGGSKLNGCYYLEVAVDETMQYWVRSNEVCIGNVGIEEADALNVTLAPNPVVRGNMVTLAVEAGNSDLQGSEIQVYDAQGRLVLNLKNTCIFEADFASGMYMVRLTLNDGRSVVKRLIVR